MKINDRELVQLQATLIDFLPYREEGYGIRPATNSSREPLDYICDRAVMTVFKLVREWYGLSPDDVSGILAKQDESITAQRLNTIERGTVRCSHKRMAEYIIYFARFYEMDYYILLSLVGLMLKDNFDAKDGNAFVAEHVAEADIIAHTNTATKLIDWMIRAEDLRYRNGLDCRYMRNDEFKRLMQRLKAVGYAGNDYEKTQEILQSY